MFGALADALDRGISMGKAYGIGLGIFAFVLVILYHIRKKSDEEKLNQMPAEKRFQIQQKQDNLETMGTLIGCFLAIIISIVMVCVFIWG